MKKYFIVAGYEYTDCYAIDVYESKDDVKNYKN